MTISANPIFLKLATSKKDIVILEGGTGSGKTYSVLYHIVFTVSRVYTGQIITVARATLSEMKKSVYRDFIGILEKNGLYNENDHNKSEMFYTLNGNTIEFIGLDKASKRKGARRDFLYCNEADELSVEDWVQLSGRTRKTIWIDYNPVFIEHAWIDPLIDSGKVDFLRTNYLDNYDFLSPREIQRIEALAAIDPFYEKVYVKGERAVIKGVIYTKVKSIPSIPTDISYELDVYGLDFGYSNSPTALVRVRRRHDDLYLKQYIHETGLTNADIDRMMTELGVSKSAEIIADSAEPKSIEELRRMGWNIKPALKGADGIINGISTLQRFNLLIDADSPQVKREFMYYKWKEKRQLGGETALVNEPLKINDHAPDAVRYVALNKIGQISRRRAFA